MPLANVALTDTFDVWRIRTNQIIVSLDSAESNVVNVSAATTIVNTATQGAFTRANSANYFAFLVNANTVAAFNYANSSFVTLNTAINVAYTRTASAHDKANAANVLAYSSGVTASAAFSKANNALANATGTFAGDLVITGNVRILGNLDLL